MIARWPGRVAAGKESSAPWYFADFMPTAAGLAGLKPPSCDGRDVLPLLTGKQSDLPTRFLYWESPGKLLEQAVRFSRWKGYRAGLDGALELYDLSNDPSEKRNVAAVHPQVVAQIGEYLRTVRTESPNWPTRKLP